MNGNVREKLSKLESIVNYNMGTFEDRYKSAKLKAFWMKLTIVILSAGITLVLGLKLGVISSTIALILSSILTVLTVMDQFLGITSAPRLVQVNRAYLLKLKVDLDFYLIGTENPTEEKWLEFKAKFDEFFDNLVESGNKELKGLTNKEANES